MCMTDLLNLLSKAQLAVVVTRSCIGVWDFMTGTLETEKLLVVTRGCIEFETLFVTEVIKRSCIDIGDSSRDK